MPHAPANGIEIYYDTFGDPDDVPLLLIMGLGSQAIQWDVDLCTTFVDRGFYVIRYDNRDVGLSTKIDTPDLDFATEFLKAFGGHPEEVHAPYRLSDMAADAVRPPDPLGLVDVSGGRRTAEVIPGAEYIEVEDMGHDLPRQLWPVFVEAITRQVAKVGEAA